MKTFQQQFLRNSFLLVFIFLVVLISYLWQSPTTGRFLFPFSLDSSSRLSTVDGEQEWPQTYPNAKSDCTNGVTSTVGVQTAVCTAAFNQACKTAKAGALVSFGPSCVKWCVDQGKADGTLSCDCPIMGNNPLTGEPYTCSVIGPTGNCSVTTVAICGCLCTEKSGNQIR